MDFENFKDNYQRDVQEAISFIGQDVDFFTEAKVSRLLDVARRFLGDLKNIQSLDVGCGVGLTDRHLCSELGALHGVDISEGVVEKARQYNPSVHYQVYDGKVLPFEGDKFDLVFTICVMQCVPPDSWSNFVGEMRRVTRPGGLVVIFEHNPHNPLTRLVVSRCEMNVGLPLMNKRLTGNLIRENGLQLVEQNYILFFPWRGPLFRKIELGLGWLPMGAQYYIVGKKAVDGFRS